MTWLSVWSLCLMIVLTGCGQRSGHADSVGVGKPAEEKFAVMDVRDPTTWAPTRARIAGVAEPVRARFVATTGKFMVNRICEREEITPTGITRHRVIGEMAGDHLLIIPKLGVTLEQLTAMTQRIGATLRSGIYGTRVWLVSFPLVDADSFTRYEQMLQAQPEVAVAEPDWVITASGTSNDPLLSQQWGLVNNDSPSYGTYDADIDAPEAWDIATGSAVVTVAVLDSGIDYTHPDLAANMWSNPGETGVDALGRDKRSNGVDDDNNGFVDDWHGWDFINGDNDPMDDHGHGTVCAGIIGAVGDNGVGVSGVAQRVSLVGLKWLGSNNRGYISDAAACMAYGVQLGIPVFNCSWGADYDSTILRDAFTIAAAAHTLVVVAAMNDSQDIDSRPRYPASYTDSNMLVVGASTRSEGISSISNYGAQSVDLFAPGDNILSTIPGGGYQLWSGTSMAAPHATGAAVLLLAHQPGQTPEGLIATLSQSVDHKSAYQGRCATNGRLNARAALDVQVARGGSKAAACEITKFHAIVADIPNGWFIQGDVVHGGLTALQSYGDSTLVLDVTAKQGDILNFWAKFSLQFDSLDAIRVYHQGALSNSIDQSIDWHQYSIQLQDGSNHVEIAHSYSGVWYRRGSTAWLDDFSIVKINQNSRPQIQISQIPPGKNVSEACLSNQAIHPKINAGDVTHLSFFVYNSGTLPLTIDSGQTNFYSMRSFALWSKSVSLTPGVILYPGDSRYIHVWVSPEQATYAADLIVCSNDPQIPVFTVPVRSEITGFVQLGSSGNTVGLML